MKAKTKPEPKVVEPVEPEPVIEPVEEEVKPEPKKPAKPMIKLRSLTAYHNGSIVGGVGIYWNVGEVREVTWEQYQQIMSDSSKFERVA